MRMVRCMCNVKVKDRVPSKELRKRLGIDYIILILQQNRLRWYGHVLQKEDTDWVKKCMEYEVDGSRPRGRPKRTWKEVVQKHCQARNLNKEDATDPTFLAAILCPFGPGAKILTHEVSVRPTYCQIYGSVKVCGSYSRKVYFEQIHTGITHMHDSAQ